MVCGPRRGGNVTIRSLWLVLALTETGGRAALQGAVREAADLRQPAAAVHPGDRTARRLAPWELPQAFSHLALIQRVRALIREDERIGAG